MTRDEMEKAAQEAMGLLTTLIKGHALCIFRRASGGMTVMMTAEQHREALKLEQQVRAVVAPHLGTGDAMPALTLVLIEHAMNAKRIDGTTLNRDQVMHLVLSIVDSCLDAVFNGGLDFSKEQTLRR